MEALGRLFNVVPTADGAAVSLRHATGVSFLCVGADTYTVTVADTAGGSYATPGNVVSHYYANAQVNGSAAWTRATQAASNAVTLSGGCAVVTVDADSLPDGKAYIKCTSSSAGLVVALTHDLTVQRAPQNLPALGA